MLSFLSLTSKVLLVFAVGAATSSLASATARQNYILKTTRPSNVIVLAHRACWAKAPENSVAAIKACEQRGVDEVEIDVRMTKDGALVIMHDETVDRTTDGKGAIADLTAAQIGTLRLRLSDGGSAAPLTNQHVPTLEQALKAARGKIMVNVHFKAPVQAQVASLVKRLKMVGQVTTWVVAKSNAPLLLTLPLKGAIGIIPTLHECGPQYPEPCWSLPMESLEPFGRVRPVAFFLDWRQSHAFIEAVSRAKRPVGTRIFVETINRVDDLPADKRRAEWGALLDLGVSVIMTNQPRDLIDYLGTVGHREGHGRLERAKSSSCK
jgi:glycerophosphoryl diester phosphodiesterase